MRKQKVYKTCVTRPKYIIDRNGEILCPTERKDVLARLKNDIHDINTIATFIVRNDVSLQDRYRNLPNKNIQPAAIGRALGIQLPDYAKAVGSGNSRKEELLRYNVVTLLKSWVERISAANGENQKYISAGWKRTVRDSKPSFVSDGRDYVNLGAVDKQYARILNDPFVDGCIELRMVVSGEWYVLVFDFDVERFKDAAKICLPVVSVDDGDRVVFGFPVEYCVPRRQLSKYVIGVDVGLRNYVTYSVVDSVGNTVVESGVLSCRVSSLWNSVRASERQVVGLRRKGCFFEAVYHREAASRKKRELAILVGQEIADLSFRYGNAAVVVEDLSWVRNTMQNGRWARGELLKWVEHYQSLNGGVVIRVNAANTSRDCSVCGERGYCGAKRLFRCSVCGNVVDRDVNAAINIARRGFVVVERFREVRVKNKDSVVKRLSPVARKGLRYPCRKQGGTRRRVVRKKRFGVGEVCSSDSVVYPGSDNSITVLSDVLVMGPVQDSRKAIRFLEGIDTNNTT